MIFLPLILLLSSQPLEKTRVTISPRVSYPPATVTITLSIPEADEKRTCSEINIAAYWYREKVLSESMSPEPDCQTGTIFFRELHFSSGEWTIYVVLKKGGKTVFAHDEKVRVLGD